jgi:hypothetical protein
MKSQDNEKDFDNHIGRVMGWVISTTLGKLILQLYLPSRIHIWG